MAVLAYEDHVACFGDGDYVYPCGVFEDVEFGVDASVGESHGVATDCEPRAAEEVFAFFDGPFAGVVVDGVLRHCIIFLAGL